MNDKFCMIKTGFLLIQNGYTVCLKGIDGFVKLTDIKTIYPSSPSYGIDGLTCDLYALKKKKKIPAADQAALPLNYEILGLKTHP